jgi:S1/P1 Nuclease
MKITSAIAFTALAFTCSPACGWDSFGHMEVAAVAWSKLTPAARARATELLKLNPEYSSWISHTPAKDRDQVAFVTAATWPDFIKHATGYHSDGPANGDRPPPGPEASQNIGYKDHFMHKYWHFIDEPFSPDGTALHNPDTPNAQTQIAAFRAKLSDPGTSAEDKDIKSYDLAWLLHLIGDVHQPLHATSRFTHDLPNGDAGGNDVKIHCGSGCSAVELHGFWDSVLGTSAHAPDAINAAKGLPKPDAQLASIADEKVWIEESFKAAKADVYAQPIGVGVGPFALTAGYRSAALNLAKQRVALAGARLANLLNAALK